MHVTWSDHLYCKHTDKLYKASKPGNRTCDKDFYWSRLTLKYKLCQTSVFSAHALAMCTCRTLPESDLIVWHLKAESCQTNEAMHAYLIIQRMGDSLVPICLLFISYKFVKGFLAITFLLLLISSWNFHDLCQRFLYNRKRNFRWIRQRMRNFPIEKYL